VLLVDNYDSYTYNLYDLIATVRGRPPLVLRNDELGPTAAIRRQVSHVVISPGPGHPADPVRVGGCPRLITRAGLPVLGVCLGHQAIALAFGGAVTPVDPRHGRRSRIRHDGRGVLRGLPQGFRAVRYHSLAVTAVPAGLRVAATAEDGVVMALRHERLPLHGVQFHPESVCAEHGERILANFLGRRFAVAAGPTRTARARTAAPTQTAPTRPAGTLVVGEAPWRDPEDVFAALYAHRRQVCWLDSGGPAGPLARRSYLGAPEGPRGHVLSYRVADGAVTLAPGEGSAVPPATLPGDLFGVLRERLARLPVDPGASPVEFAGGYLGCLGYAVPGGVPGTPATPAGSGPDAAFAYVERFLAFDHERRRLYAVAVAAPGERPAAQDWVDRAVRAVRATGAAPPPARGASRSDVRATMGRDGYGAAFRAVRRHLWAGDTYEVNLTFRLAFECTADHAELYRHLRRVNPAPFAAFLRLPPVSVLCSSPERFLRVDPDGRVEARPIKGSAPRHADPAADALAAAALARQEKTFAENLMVTDLLRNDLARVCRPGTVAVPALMAVESYPSMHQLVSTVTGVLAPGVDALACVRAAFPGGSMTGAPKLRTMEIIDAVEADPRGLYSGALGFLSLSGHADLNVVIRTIVASGSAMTIGVGGGVVAMSAEAGEYAEARLKAAALLAAVDRACGRDEPARGPAPK
jgi:para-aminobenzoate synthetase